jgi:hypothetical protein
MAAVPVISRLNPASSMPGWTGLAEAVATVRRPVRLDPGVDTRGLPAWPGAGDPAGGCSAVSQISTSIGASGLNTRLSTCSARSSQ